jgi:hypothetical protein
MIHHKNALSSFGRRPCDAGDHDHYHGRSDEPAAHENILLLGHLGADPGNSSRPPVWHGQGSNSHSFPADFTRDRLCIVCFGYEGSKIGYLLKGIDWSIPQRSWRPQAAG